MVRDDLDQFRLEEEMARVVADKETVEAKYKALEKRSKALQNDFVCLFLTYITCFAYV